MRVSLLTILILLLAGHTGMAQNDKDLLAGKSLFVNDTLSPVGAQDTPVVQSLMTPVKKKHDPRVATRRSLMIPGWGQAYNKQYWKIPVVYGVLAIPASLYFYNNSWYKKTKFAYEGLFDAQLPIPDSSKYNQMDPRLKGLSLGSLQSYRNAFRRDRDYSILWFILAWGLQIADATVFGHLKDFDVTDDLSMRVNPSFNPHTRTPGLGFVMTLKSPPKRPTVNTR